jgi:hypothetical protein
VTNSLVIIGFEHDDATRKARKCVSLRLFGEWTLDRKELWSQSEYQKYRDVTELLRPRFETLNQQLSQTIAKTESSNFVAGVAGRNSGINLAAKTDVDQAEVLRADAERLLNGLPASSEYTISAAELETFKELRDEWTKLTKECAVAAKRLIALFSIIARNDKRTLRELERPIDAGILASHGVVVGDSRFSDPVLRAYAKLIRSAAPTSEPWYNSILWSSLSVFGIAAGVISAYRMITENRAFQELLGSSGPFNEFSNLVPNAVTKALLDAFFIALACWFASVTALFIRSSKLREEEWLPFYGFKTIPISSYGGVFFAATVAAFPALVLQYISYYRWSGQSTVASSMLEVMATNVGISISLGFYAVGLCILTDVVSMKHRENYFTFCLLICLPAIIVNAVVLLVSPGYFQRLVYFINQNLLYIIVSYGGMLIFARSLQSRLNPTESVSSDGQQFVTAQSAI